MVKKKTGGGKRYKAVAQAKDAGLSKPQWDGPAPPQHLQKKISRKVNFLDKVATAHKSLQATRGGVRKKTSGRKRPLPDLASLGGVLSEVAQAQADKARAAKDSKHKPLGMSVNSSKQRMHILERESARLQQVLHHPAYKADPLAAITAHLKLTLPPAPVRQAPGKGKGKGGKKGQSQQQKQKSMDMVT